MDTHCDELGANERKEQIMKKGVLTHTLVAAAVLTSSGVATAAGDINAGKARAAVCGACHGINGEGNPAFPDPANPGKTKAVPALAGQNAGYFAKQIHDFKSGARKDALMTGQALPLGDSDIANMGAYYASITPKPIDADASLVAKGEQLYLGGDMTRGISACMACHGPDAEGNDLAKWPALDGQLTGYTSAQLHAFRSGDRSNDPNNMMRDVASQLSNNDIEAVSAYLASIGAAATKTVTAAPAPTKAATAEKTEEMKEAPALVPAMAEKEAAAAPAVVTSGGADGAALFQASCFACHGPAAPALNAPQSGVKANWVPRMEKAGGLDGLVANAINGVPGTAMAPRGGSGLSDDELKAAVEYMLSQSGL